MQLLLFKTSYNKFHDNTSKPHPKQNNETYSPLDAILNFLGVGNTTARSA